MTRITLSLACTLSDRTRPVLDGRVSVPGVDFLALPGEPEDIFRRALRDKAFEVSELSMGSHIVTTARGDSPYVGVPVFLSRAFRHSAVYIRTDRGIRGAADLAGRTIGLPEYQQTAALWVRGFLRDHYGEKETITPDLSKKDIASAIGATPETFSRLLQKLEKSAGFSWRGKTIQVNASFWEAF